MSKKHFIALADTLRNCKPLHPGEPGLDRDTYLQRVSKLRQWEDMCAALAGFCRSQNANFNTQRWFDYIDGVCGPNGGKL